jgi:NitT/TauT family transport system permease protein
MNRLTLIRLAAIGVLVALIELVCRVGLITPYTLIPPSQMVAGLFELMRSGEFASDMLRTVVAIMIAISAAVILGLVGAIVLSALPRLRRALDPLMATYYSVPVFVFYPLFIVLFGLNDVPKVVIGFLLGVVAMITSSLNGFDRVPAVLRKTARVHRLGRVATIRRVVLPSAAPHIFNGIKLAVAYAFVGVLGAEFILSTGGIGYRIAYAFNDFDNRRMYALVVLILVVVSVVNAALFGWERRLRQRRGLT